ncbi:hypothetical protein H6504_05815 [Candidatus Woesearchaeota archaeon]|nr:hypothetical protein [Candidatus Woesearchaeota archaeon]
MGLRIVPGGQHLDRILREYRMETERVTNLGYMIVHLPLLISTGTLPEGTRQRIREYQNSTRAPNITTLIDKFYATLSERYPYEDFEPVHMAIAEGITDYVGECINKGDARRYPIQEDALMTSIKNMYPNPNDFVGTYEELHGLKGELCAATDFWIDMHVEKANRGVLAGLIREKYLMIEDLRRKHLIAQAYDLRKEVLDILKPAKS